MSTGQPQPTLSLDEMRGGQHNLATQRRNAVIEYETAAAEGAENDRDYRRTLAVRFTNLRAEGKGAGEAELLAKGEDDVSDLALRRDMAASKAKAALLRVELLEREQATLRSVYEAGARVDGGTS